MAAGQSSYRPHDPGHNYYAPGIYLITLVIRDREKHYSLLGSLNDNLKQPEVTHTAIGKAILEEWQKIPTFEASKGRKIKLHNATCMPDHFHGVIEVLEPMDVSLGQVIWGFKVSCTKRYRQLSAAQPMTAVAAALPLSSQQPSLPALLPSSQQPSLAAPSSQQPSLAAPIPSSQQPSLPALPLSSQQPSLAALPLSSQQPSLAAPIPDLHRMSKKQRALYYSQHPEAQQPLWDDNYDDTICLNDQQTGTYDLRHLSAMLRYVSDNPRRAIICRLRPQYMRRCLHIKIDGRDYAAFGNLFLLRWAKKVQVFCHRKAADGRTPYEATSEYESQRKQWISQILAGCTVIVTPGISRGEQIMKHTCLNNSYPLIHLQKEPISCYWKPEAKRFEACTKGSLLILAPWQPDTLGEVDRVPSNTNYSMFHNLNTLAQELCTFEGDAVIVGK